MVMIFRPGEENTGERSVDRPRVLTVRRGFRAYPTKRPVDVCPPNARRATGEKARQADINGSNKLLKEKENEIVSP